MPPRTSHHEHHCTHTHDEQFAAVLHQLGELAKHVTKLSKLTKEIKNTMATQAEVDAVTQQLDDIKTNVAAQGAEIAKIGADLTAFIANNPNVSVAALAAKATEVGTAISNAGAALQALDDQLPEQSTP